MAQRPRIALPVPTSADLAYNRVCLPLYLQAIEQSGGHPVLILLDASARSAVQKCDGVVLPGSPADVNPARYGQPLDPASAAEDASRERTDAALLEEAERRRTPVLGICYGLQSLNVFRGGSLLQHVSVLPVNHAAGPSVAIAHHASVLPNTCLSALTDATEAPAREGAPRLAVNSSHHQAVAALGDGLRISARCPQDAVIEAIEPIEDRAPFFLGVQWHPERSYAGSPTSRALFDHLVAQARG